MSEILYKYRTIDNLKNFIDIILNNRLYAANYQTMNDPMEGHYLYDNNVLNQEMRNMIYDGKMSLNFCSLSKKDDNFLMWSHYANGHRGVAIGVKIDRNQNNVREVNYLKELTNINILDENTSRNILSQKLDLWHYEEEVRVFSTDNYIDVQIEKVIIGKKMNTEDKDFITKLIKKINPDIEICSQNTEDGR